MRKFAVATALWLLPCIANAATLLPNGQQQFVNALGVPYVGGKVYFYSNFPTCSVPKATYQDAAGSVPNTNPVVLDSAGRATIFGTGAYCQVLKDAAGNTIWTKYTSDTSSASNLGWGGTSTGTANAQQLTVSAFAGDNGQVFYFLAGATNTGAMTLTVNGSLTASVVQDVPNGTKLLSGGEVVAGNVVGVAYDQPTGRFHLITNNVRQFGAPTSLPAAINMDLNAAPSHTVNITGSGVNITSFGAGGASSTQNSIYFVTLAGANTIVYNATSMITPTGTNLSLQAGATLTVLYLGGSNWQILQYTAGAGLSGQVSAFAMDNCPAGWLLADGSEVSATTYPGLATALGVTWGAAAAGNVKLPDFRGMFLRGRTAGRTTDPLGGALTAQTTASFVDDKFEAHTHTVSGAIIAGGSTTASGAGQTPSTVTTSSTGGTETNPKNLGITYCVQW